MKKSRKYQIAFGMILLVLLTFASCKKKQPTGDLFNEKYRPQYHFSYPDRWMNDPTGMIYYKGRYHLNFRNASSTDLIHWDFSLKERERNDSIQMMSGSSVIDWNNSSGFGSNDEPPIVAIYSELRHKDFIQQQSVGYSNDGGGTFIPYKGNPVIDINNTEFRDPMVFWHKPTQKWVMAVALAGECKVRFYGSKNLKEWDFLSDFGPAGAREGVWECPDLFPLVVDGDSTNIKWVLEIDVQPVSGQYFIGDFDGKKFTVDPEFDKIIGYNDYKPEGEVLFDFESDLAGWKIEGDAFRESPTENQFYFQCAVLGKEGNKFVDSFYDKDASRGKLTSPEFKITHDYINFLIGGGNHPEKECVNLLVDEKIVRTKTGYNTEALKWAGWDVTDFKGKTANLEIVDDYDGGFGHITVDHVMQCDEMASDEREQAPWIDYGPDFYAVRSWVNMPENDNRRIWLAWMSNWLYAHDVPTSPWIGFQSFPRTVELKTIDDGIRLVQNPIKEIEMLRGKHFRTRNLSISGQRSIDGFQPEKNTYELIAELKPGENAEVGFKLCMGDGEETVVGYDAKTGKMYVDRNNSGESDFSTSFRGMYSGPLKRENGRVKLHVLVDQSSIEVFGNDGETVISCLIFPDTKSLGIEAFSKEGNSEIVSLDIWELKSIWRNEY